MQGMTVFRSLVEALRAGFEVHDRIAAGYLMRTRTNRGYALAIVDLTSTRR
jgi:hypothetical protein